MQPDRSWLVPVAVYGTNYWCVRACQPARSVLPTSARHRGQAHSRQCLCGVCVCVRARARGQGGQKRQKRRGGRGAAGESQQYNNSWALRLHHKAWQKGTRTHPPPCPGTPCHWHHTACCPGRAQRQRQQAVRRSATHTPPHPQPQTPSHPLPQAPVAPRARRHAAAPRAGHGALERQAPAGALARQTAQPAPLKGADLRSW